MTNPNPMYPRMLLCGLGLFVASFSAQADLAQLSLRFYTEQINLQYDPSLVLDREVIAKEANMVYAYRALEKRNYRPLLQNLERVRDQLALNDWLYYQLLRQAVVDFYPSSRPIARELTIWFLLSKSGFDTRITYRDKTVSIYVYTLDDIFEAALIRDRNRTFVNLTGLSTKDVSRKALYMLEYTANPRGRSFDFSLQQWPRMKVELEERKLEFNYQDQEYELEVEVDRNIAEIMSQYPYLSEAQYLQAPMSNTLKASLLPQLRRLTAEMSEREQLELLVAITRSGFMYKEDKDFFGRSKPMVAEEVFCYPYSDCEDRSALFQSMIKELFNYPTIAIAYDDHLTVGVALEGLEGDAVRYENRLYVFCDPTGPANSSVIGEIPEGYENQSFEIVFKSN